MKKIVFLSLVFGLAGCGKSQEQLNKEKIESEKLKLKKDKDNLDLEVQMILKSTLNDPDSAQFRNQNKLCGEVNAKNSFGGYIGFTKFIITEEKIYFENEYQDSQISIDGFNSLWDLLCK